jgi:hypothetical protein
LSRKISTFPEHNNLNFLAVYIAINDKKGSENVSSAPLAGKRLLRKTTGVHI